ncbi:NUDIX domain-containing protein [Paraburkholderia sp. UCT31]|uniref:NUDIX domain-containing protein n=1 Tax=Paraburkholderia sp. UCT31 TaxID=2615209 RepID=UPI00165674A4|nr:NUDIX domain-containing protein [Paraburkholderia sp. UCT31]MBC8741722.1 NUDIX domain-containing protein [Paraburkholderia sp. UCT31]
MTKNMIFTPPAHPWPSDCDHDAIVLIGRMQPGMHLGHQELLERGLERAENVVVALGSCFRARSPKQPLRAVEREASIRSCLTDEQNRRVKFVYIRDYYDDQRWCAAVREGVQSVTGKNAKIGLIGHEKDRSSYYLHRFPEWKLFNELCVGGLNGTDVRALWFERDHERGAEAVLRTMLPEGTFDFLMAFKKLPDFESLRKQHYAILRDAEKWKAAPHVPNHSCGDAVAEFRDHVLLIERGGDIGTGTFAWPGGFLEPDETVIECAMRELIEETKLGILPEYLKTFIRDRELFDNPWRSEAGRRMSHAFHFVLDEAFAELSEGEFPFVQGKSDARRALWLPKKKLPSLEEYMFEDHHLIGDRFFHYA